MFYWHFLYAESGWFSYWISGSFRYIQFTCIGNYYECGCGIFYCRFSGAKLCIGVPAGMYGSGRDRIQYYLDHAGAKFIPEALSAKKNAGYLWKLSTG